jgi:hypothetical protein
MRVRYRGAAAQWGAGDDVHGWQVWRPGETWWRRPTSAAERAAVLACQALPRERFTGPRGAEVS